MTVAFSLPARMASLLPDVELDGGERPAYVLVSEKVVAAARQVVVDSGGVRPPGINPRWHPVRLARHGLPPCSRKLECLSPGQLRTRCDTFRVCTVSQGADKSGCTGASWGRMAGRHCRGPGVRSKAGADNSGGVTDDGGWSARAAAAARAGPVRPGHDRPRHRRPGGFLVGDRHGAVR